MIEKVIEEIVLWLKDYLHKSNTKGFVFGISGGIDSSVVATILEKYFPDKYNSFWIDIESSKYDYDCVKLLVNKKKIKYEEINLNNIFSQIKNDLNLQGLIENNFKSRLRMSVLYAKAQELNYLVIGTTNLIEYQIGYFTKYGDGAADISPLRDLLKRDIKEIAKYLDIPMEIINRDPSAGFYKDQKDEEEIGIKYNDLDNFFSNQDVPLDVKEKIEKKIKESEHKRICPKSPLLMKSKRIYE